MPRHPTWSLVIISDPISVVDMPGQSSSLTFGYIRRDVTTVPLAEAKDRLSEYIAGVERTHDRVVITRHGRPTAVLVSPDDLAALEETVNVLTTPGASEAIAEGLADLDAGRVSDNDALRARFAQE